MKWFLIIWAILPNKQITVFPADLLAGSGLFDTKEACEVKGIKATQDGIIPIQPGEVGYHHTCIDLSTEH